MLLIGCGRIGFEAERVDGPEAPIACPPTYETVGGGCYRIVENSSEFDWAVNEAGCEADGPTAHLMVIDDAAEIQVVLDLLAANSIVDVALGFSDRLVEGEYRSVTGGPAFIEFASNEPNGDLEDCGGIDRGGGIVGMEDIDCNNANDYICEVDGDPADPLAF
jgi:hypothetical protein